MARDLHYLVGRKTLIGKFLNKMFSHAEIEKEISFASYAPVICNHGPTTHGGVPGIAGEMYRIFTFALSPQFRTNAVDLFTHLSNGDHSRQFFPCSGGVKQQRFYQLFVPAVRGLQEGFA